MPGDWQRIGWEDMDLKSQESMLVAEAIRELRRITDPDEYFRTLGKYKEHYLICVAVKDTFFQIPANTGQLLTDLGFTFARRIGKCFPQRLAGLSFCNE